MIRFISTSVTIPRNCNQYSVIADLHTLQFTVAHALGFSVFTSRLLATETQKLELQITIKSSCYLFSNHSILLCPNLYSNNLHNSLRTRSVLVFVLSTAETSWTLFSWRLHVLDSSFLSYDWLQMTFTVPYKPLHGPHRNTYYCRRDCSSVAEHWAWRGPHWKQVTDYCLTTSYKHSSYYCVRDRGVFIELLPGNALSCHNMLTMLFVATVTDHEAQYI
jgi:hypothetical protein